MKEADITKNIEKWRPMIENMANRWQNSIASRDDLIQEGILGVIRGVRDYNPERGGDFKSYIYQCIKSQIIVTAQNNAHPVYCPAGTTMVNKKVRAEQECRTSKTCHYTDAEDDALCIEDKGLNSIEIEDFIDNFDPRKILRMHFIEGVSFKEISERFGVTRGCISKYIAKVRDTIWRELKNRR